MPAVSLREITRENVKPVCKLRVKPEQQGFVASNGQSLAEARFADGAWTRAIYADEQLVGFVMLAVLPQKAEYFLWRFMIDAAHQGRGYGRRALEHVIDHVRTLPGAEALHLSHHKGDGSPEGFYLKMGFRPTGKVEGDDHFMKVELSDVPNIVSPVDVRLDDAHFPRSSTYHPEWVLENGFGANPLWLAEWLTTNMDLRPGMRVLDLGCGRAKSSIFLAREFDIEVWATDLWHNASENVQRIQDAGVADRVFPIHADARALPFAADFFDAAVAIDSFSYFGSDALYLNYFAQFVKIGGQIGIAGAGLMKEFVDGIPPNLNSFWTNDCWGLHSPEWWRDHWQRTGIVDVEVADAMPDGWRAWLDWYTTAFPNAKQLIGTLEADRGEYLGYIRMVGRRNAAKLEDYCWPDTMRSFPMQYERKPLMRGN